MLISCSPNVELPSMLEEVPLGAALYVLEQLEAAADAGALPGFETDPRGGAIVELWREKLLRKHGEEGRRQSG